MSTTPKTKLLYVLVRDGGDGSYYPVFTFDAQLIASFEQADEQGLLGGDGDVIGVDGDGFHYTTITVPAHATAESLGIDVVDADAYQHLFAKD